MSKGRFTSHSQHLLTACVSYTVKLCCWDTPPTTGGAGGHSQCEAQGGPTANTLSCKEKDTNVASLCHPAD